MPSTDTAPTINLPGQSTNPARRAVAHHCFDAIVRPLPARKKPVSQVKTTFVSTGYDEGVEGEGMEGED
jgi:hypothetical protein